MRINIFTAPAIAYHLNRVRKEGRADDVNRYIDGINRESEKKFKAADRDWMKSPRGSVQETAALLRILSVRGTDVGVAIIAAILGACEVKDSWKEACKKTEEKIKPK